MSLLLHFDKFPGKIYDLNRKSRNYLPVRTSAFRGPVSKGPIDLNPSMLAFDGAGAADQQIGGCTSQCVKKCVVGRTYGPTEVDLRRSSVAAPS